MARSNFSLQHVLLSTSVLLGSSIPLLLSSSTLALPRSSAQLVPSSSDPRGMLLIQDSTPRADVLSTLKSNFVPPDKPQPDKTESSATRDRLTCADDPEPFQILSSPEGYGLSTQPRPAISVQVPPTSAKAMTLVFQNDENDYYERTSFALGDSQTTAVSDPLIRNLHRLSLPEYTPSLEPFKLYRWFVVVHCEDSVQPDDPVFTGWIEYRPSRAENPQGLLRKLAWIDRIKWYGQQGYWYDMVDQLVQ